MAKSGDESITRRLRAVERRFAEHAGDVAIFFVYDRPDRVNERPQLARTFFAERCVSDAQLDKMIETFRSSGAYVELFDGERPFIEALAEGRLQSISRPIKLAYDGTEGGVAAGGFQPGRKSLVPVISDSYQLVCANSNAYACALGRHKFHYLKLLRALGEQVPRTWHFRGDGDWAAGQQPEPGLRVIAKSTYESWSVGVTEDSVFTVDASCEERVGEISERIGQPVTVQEFISGREVCVPVLASPEAIATPPMQAFVARAPDDLDAVMTIDDTLADGGLTHRRLESDDRLDADLCGSACRAFRALELSAFGRLDFRVDMSGTPWLFDVAVSPGIGAGSSAYRSLQELGFDYPEFLRAVVGATLATHEMI